MSLRILILDAYNNKIIKSFVNKNKSKMSTYKEGNKIFADSYYFMAGYYSKYFNKLGHKAHELVVNCVHLQDLWIKEHDLDFEVYSDGWFYKLLEIQIKEYKADIIYCRHITYFDHNFLAKIKNYTTLLVGQCGSILPENIDLSIFDFIITPLFSHLEKFQKLGTKGELVSFAFDKDILTKINKWDDKIDVSFVGCLGKDEHGVSYFDESTNLFENAAKKLDINFWGPTFLYNNFKKESCLLKNYQGEAWGIDMYNILANSKITLNRHAELAGPYAANIRLFEATGTGALLLTDEKKNLNSYFESDKEVITYNSLEDLIDKAKYFLKHDKERIEIAKTGQQKTLNTHTYDIRIKEIIDLFYKYL